MCRTRSATSRLLVGPSLDLGTQPELDAALSEIENRSRHIAVPLLVLEHRVAIGQTEDLGNALRVDQVTGVDVDHRASLHRYADPSDGPVSLTI